MNILGWPEHFLNPFGYCLRVFTLNQLKLQLHGYKTDSEADLSDNADEVIAVCHQGPVSPNDGRVFRVTMVTEVFLRFVCYGLVIGLRAT